MTNLPLPIAGLFLVLSGMAALVYQVVWVRLLALSMGSTSASVSTVISAFFLGLAAGSLLAERLTRTGYPLRRYLLLEATIAGSAFVLLPALLRLDYLLAWMPAIGTHTIAKLVVTMVLLAIPTMCMGATFPVMAALLVRTSAGMSRRISQLYSLNTFGAVIGAWSSGFVLIPALGLDGAVYTAIAMNLSIVAIGALWLARDGRSRVVAGVRALSRQPSTQEAVQGAPQDRSDVIEVSERPARRVRIAALTVLTVTGFTSIAAEVAWTKYLSILTGTTLYGFASILTVFLSGIAAGAWFAKHRSPASRNRLTALGGQLLLLSVLMIASRSALGLGPRAYAVISQADVGPVLRMALTFAYLGAVLLPPTLLFGALFPRALDTFCGSVDRIRSRAGTAYAVNTFAGIAGSLLAGFVLIPMIGTDRVLGILAALIALAGLALTSVGGARRAIPVVVTASVLGAAVLAPGLDYHALIEIVDNPTDGRPDHKLPQRFVFLEEGRGGVISVSTWNGHMAVLQSNGLTESHLNMVDPRTASLTESLLGLMPYLLHREPRSAFVVGFGGGNTAYALTTTFWLQEIDVVELEPAIVAGVTVALRGTPPALLDPRTRLEIGDARNRLIVGDRRYDIIVSQPSHPWLAGATSVFSREFFEITRSRLAPGGIFAQWVNLFRMDATTLRSILSAFYGTYSHGFVLIDRSIGELLLIGALEPPQLEQRRVEERMSKPETRRLLAVRGVNDAADLLMLYGFSREAALEAAAGAEPNTDTNLISEVRLAALRTAPTGDEDPKALVERTRTMDVARFIAPDWRDSLLGELATRLEAAGRSPEAESLRSRDGG